MEKGFVYIMDFGPYDEHRRIIKCGKSVRPGQRLEQHQKGGNAFVRGREGKILIAVPISYYNQERYEDLTRERMDNMEGCERAFHCRDTFLVDTRIVKEVSIKIRKTYTARIA